MYSSLKKLDIVTKGKDGRELVVQTDHRTAEEVDAEREVSVLFGLTRMLLPRGTKYHDAAVRYVAMGKLHPELARVVVAVGGEAESEGQPVDLAGTPKVPTADLADEAFAALGKKILAREGLTADEAGLLAYEESIEPDDNDPEEDGEIGHWTQVVEIAAVAGEVIRALHGGRWVDQPGGHATLPFMFQVKGDTGFTNVVGKTENFLDHGMSHAPHVLLRAIEERNEPMGPLLPSMKPSTWGGKDTVVCEPLALAGAAQIGIDVPLIAYGNDRPQTFAMRLKTEGETVDLEALRREAIGNLAAIQVEVQKVDAKTLTFYVVHGSYFACEKLLDEKFMKKMHAELDSEMLAAAVPTKSQLFLTNGAQAPEAMGGFMNVARSVFEKNEGGRQISPTVFIVMEGKVAGVITPQGGGTPEPPPPKKKGFFSRVFGGG